MEDAELDGAELLDWQADYFHLFGLPRRFMIDAVTLENSYRRRIAEVHPDRFAVADQRLKRQALQAATRINQAYKTLQSPRSRAIYLLELGGVDIGLETNTAMARDFLLTQMQWREEFEESNSAKDSRALLVLDQQLQQHRQHYLQEIAEALDDNQDLPQAAKLVRELMFIDKMREQTQDALELLES